MAIKKNASKLPNLFTNKLLKINIVYILGILLVIASFLIGVLVTKISYLEKGGAQKGVATDQTSGGQPQAPAGPVDVEQGHLPILGNKDAKVTVVEFSDFQCPFCKSLFSETLPQLKKDYIDTGKIKFAYRHFPISSIHPNAQKAAEASECANDQGKFWEYHDQLFINQADWESLDTTTAQTKFGEFAGSLGLDTAKFGQCLSSGQFAGEVNKDLDEGTAAGVNGTPATFVNGLIVEGAVPYAEFKSIIEQELAK